MNDFQLLFDKVLDDGLDDWMMLSNIIGSVRKRNPDDPEQVRALSTELIRKLIEGGWMVPGDLGPSGFEAWNLNPKDAVRRIIQELDDVDWDTSRDIIAWLDTTPQGLERANRHRA